LFSATSFADGPHIQFGFTHRRGDRAGRVGRDGGDYGFDFYMETKNMAVAYGTDAIPRMGMAKRS